MHPRKGSPACERPCRRGLGRTNLGLGRIAIGLALEKQTGIYFIYMCWMWSTEHRHSPETSPTARAGMVKHPNY